MSNSNRTTVISFRLSPPETRALETLAGKEARKPSEFIRELLRQEVAKRGLMLAQGEEQS